MTDDDTHTERMFPEQVERKLGIDGQIQDINYDDGLVLIEVERTE